MSIDAFQPVLMRLDTHPHDTRAFRCCISTIEQLEMVVPV